MTARYILHARGHYFVGQLDLLTVDVLVDQLFGGVGVPAHGLKLRHAQVPRETLVLTRQGTVHLLLLLLVLLNYLKKLIL
jgi:hypothetical protein